MPASSPLLQGPFVVLIVAASFWRSIFASSVSSKSTKTKLLNLEAEGTTTTSELEISDNPLWPQGIYNKDVDDLVNECLQDPTINIAAIPDYLERQLYRSTIKLTLNALYRSLAGIHGHRMLGHEFRVTRTTQPRCKRRRELRLLKIRTDVEMELLEEVADRLLANKFVNQALIPDYIERPLYVNCLKILFRVLDLLVSSFRLTVCGHDISIQMGPSQRYAIQEAALKRASASFSGIDMEIMKDIARKAGVDADEEDKKRWFWQRMLSPANNDFIAQIHASLYGLVLGIIDDLLDNTELEVLSDRIGFDIAVSEDDRSNGLIQQQKDVASKSERPPIIVAFLTGLGAGLALTPLLLQRSGDGDSHD